MDDLISRLGAAVEGSEELDREIYFAIINDPTRPRYDEDIPLYSTSLDDALTLLPDGLHWAVGAGKTHPTEPLYGAATYLPQISEDPVVATNGQHETSAPLALCIAALRARAEKSN